MYSSTEQDRSPLSEKCQYILRISRCWCKTPRHHLACTGESRQQCGLIFKGWNVLEEQSETIYPVTQRHNAEERDPHLLRWKNLKTLITVALYIHLSVWTSSFGSVFFFCICVSYTTYHSLTLFPTQLHFPRSVHPLPTELPRSNSTRVTAGPVNLQLKLNHVYRSVVHWHKFLLKLTYFASS